MNVIFFQTALHRGAVWSSEPGRLNPTWSGRWLNAWWISKQGLCDGTDMLMLLLFEMNTCVILFCLWQAYLWLHGKPVEFSSPLNPKRLAGQCLSRCKYSSNKVSRFGYEVIKGCIMSFQQRLGWCKNGLCCLMAPCEPVVQNSIEEQREGSCIGTV